MGWKIDTTNVESQDPAFVADASPDAGLAASNSADAAFKANVESQDASFIADIIPATDAGYQIAFNNLQLETEWGTLLYVSEVSNTITIDAPDSVKSILREYSLNNQKPEILLSARFLPAVDQLKRTSVGKMLEVQYMMRNLSIDNVEEILIELEKDPAILTRINGLIDNNQVLETQIESNVEIYSNVLEQLNASHLSFNIKKNTNNIKSKTESIRNSRTTWSYEPKGKYSQIISIFSQYLHFPNTSFYAFSNTKIISQLISDLKNSIKFYSPQLIANFDNNRNTDINPITINTSLVSDDSSFTFTPTSISSTLSTSTNINFDPLDQDDFNSFLESLPSSGIDKIKLIVATLSKEHRISGGISRLLYESLGNKYSVNSPAGLIERIIGDTGSAITDPIPAAGSLASLTRFKDEKNQTILPFESRLLIDSSKSKNYIPGSIFLIETILESAGTISSTDALFLYNESLSEIVDDSSEILGELLNYDGSNDAISVLHMQYLLRDIYTEVSKYTEGTYLGNPGSRQSDVLALALLKAANNDNQLKRLLFLYTIARRDDTFYVENRNLTDDDGDGITAVWGDEDYNSGAEIDGVEELYTRGSSNHPLQAIPNEIMTIIDTRFKTLGVGEYYEWDSGIELTADPLDQLGGFYAGPSTPDAFTAIIDIAAKIAEDAVVISKKRNSVTGNHGYKSGFGRTRFQNYSDDTVLLLVFEAFTSIVSEFISANFVPVALADNHIVSVDEEQNESVVSKIASLDGRLNFPDPTIKAGFTDLVSGLESIKESLIVEEQVMRDIIDCIKGIGGSVSETTANTIDLMQRHDNWAFYNENSNAFANLSKEQIALSYEGIDALLGASDSTFIPKEQIVSEKQYRILNSLLRDPSFDSTVGSNIKLLSVGLPSGMLNALQNQPVDIDTDNDSVIEAETTDIVTIKIFKRDPEFADIIFKPISFIFDISRFATISEQTVYTNSSFSTNLNTRILLKDVHGRTDLITGKSDVDIQTLDQFTENSYGTEYELLTNEEKTSIFRNHAVSNTLDTYLKLMTGINTSEFTYISSQQLLASQKLDSDVKDLLMIIPAPAGTTLAAGDVDELGRILLEDGTFMNPGTRQQQNQYKRLLNSLIFRAGHNKIRIEQPKLFERTFTVPVDPDEYIIDQPSTTFTRKGVEALRSLQGSRNIIEEPTGRFDEGGYPITQMKIKPRSKKEGNFEFSEFFVVVELGVAD
jgi:hypothetical protein